ncbi:MAG: hypothetical protein Kow002_11730 [Anaerolineales bacterium]
MPRIGIRIVDGVAEFYNTGTDEKFIPRGVNYVDFYHNPEGSYEDRVMATDVYDPERVRAAFRNLAHYGYNTVRIFFDTCGNGPACIGNYGGKGVNPLYLDNMIDLMHIAGEEGIYIIFTSNTVPQEGGYYQEFYKRVYETEVLPGFVSGQNADWLHPAGVDMKKKAWTDMMSVLAEKDAPFETVLGWQISNEFWLWKNIPPLSLTSGLVTISNGKTYDMADSDQKRQMITDGTLFYMDTIVSVIKTYDPEALITMGFFAPQFPNPTGIGGDWYVDTAPLLESAPLDFWDFHAYYDGDLSIEKQAENFGMIDYHEKPVLLGEMGAGHAIVPSAETAATLAVQWMADSCAVGFDGWLHWGYYPWPEDLDGKPWAPLESDEILLVNTSPLNLPDPCVPSKLDVENVSLGKPVRSSAQTSENPAKNAVDGGSLEWSAGNYPPQWIEVDLLEPTTVGQVGFATAQWPPGYSHHQVWARLADGRYVLLADFNGFTTVDMSLSHKLPTPVENVMQVRFLQLKSSSWAGYRNIEVISAAPPTQEACFAKVNRALRLTNFPAQDASEVSSLKAGDEVVISGFYTDAEGLRWAQVGGNAWAKADGLANGSGCENVKLTVANPGLRKVAVTFSVTVPENTEGDVFIGAYLPGTQYPSWLPWMIYLDTKPGNVYSTTLELPVGVEVQYVYTRGSWETIERPMLCSSSTDPRVFVIEAGNDILREDVVEKWRDLDCGGE